MPREDLDMLLRHVAAGDRSAFERLYVATSAKLYGIVVRILKRAELADEVMQEVYIRVWRNAASFDASKGTPITWMAAIARNRALDEARRHLPAPLDDAPELSEVEDTAMLPADHVILQSDLARLSVCIDGLPPERRDIVKLAYLEGLSREELGLRFGHPVATIKTWLHRSLKQLKTCLSS